MIFEIAACFRVFMRTARISMSSCSSLLYSALSANQRESQVRLMPSRRPIGLTFCPIVFSSGLRRGSAGFADDDRQMRERLMDTAGAAPRAGAEALQYHPIADISRGDDKVVDIEIVVVLGIGNRALQGLFHIKCASLARKFEIGKRRLDLLATDQLRKKV